MPIRLNYKPLDMYATIKYKNGKITKQEFYYGDSFLSQSGRFINIDHHNGIGNCY